MKKGFSLVEILIYVTLIGIFLSGGVTIAWRIIYGNIKANAQREVSYNLNLISKKLSHEIRNADSVTINTESSITISPQEASRDDIIFYLDGDAVMFGVGSTGSCTDTSACILSSNIVSVTDLNFENVDGLITYELVIKYKSDSTLYAWEYQNVVKGSVKPRIIE